MNEDSPHILYRMYDDEGRLLYVGITLDVEGRFRGHRSTKSWWSQVQTIKLEHHPSRAAVLAAEDGAIRDQRPLFNLRGNPVENAELDEVICGALDSLDRERNRRLAYQAKYGSPPRSKRPKTAQPETDA